jgi:hypothetical protein
MLVLSYLVVAFLVAPLIVWSVLSAKKRLDRIILTIPISLGWFIFLAGFVLLELGFVFIELGASIKNRPVKRREKEEAQSGIKAAVEAVSTMSEDAFNKEIEKMTKRGL